MGNQSPRSGSHETRDYPTGPHQNMACGSFGFAVGPSNRGQGIGNGVRAARVQAPSSEVCWRKARVLRNLAQHAGTNLLAVMESEFVVWPTFPGQHLMGTLLAND